ncbi:MAG: LuxR C-terminal-related transcriptional regulator [Thermodesulfobacteriota bacterium]
MIRLMLAVSGDLFRVGIHKILRPKKDIEIIAETITNQAIIPLIEQKKPDVLFIDTNLPNLDIVKTLESITEKSAETKILLLLHTLDEEPIIDAISLGVQGCLKPTVNPEQFIRAIRSISKEEIWAEEGIKTKVLTRFLTQVKVKPVLKPKLTKKEGEIIKLVVQGCNNKQIAKKLFISENTVKSHLVHIFKKLGVGHRLQLAINLLN